MSVRQRQDHLGISSGHSSTSINRYSTGLHLAPCKRLDQRPHVKGSWNHKLCSRTGLHSGSLECNQNSLKSMILIWTLMLWIESISWLKILWIDVPEVDKSELRISWSLPSQQGIDMDRHKLLLECGDGLIVMVLWWSRRAKHDPIENKAVLVGKGTGQVLLQSGPHSFALHPPFFGFPPSATF